jgi:phosphoenolpyruvate carboxykinase (ATP)
MTLHPAVYGNLLAKKMEKHNAQAWLLNTGWTGGPYGIGERMSIHDTRACVSAILDGKLICDFTPLRSCRRGFRTFFFPYLIGSALASSFEKDDIFGFDIPKSLPGVDPKVLNPKYSWGDPIAYEKAAKKLAQMYIENFHKYEKLGSGDYIRYGPHID